MLINSDLLDTDLSLEAGGLLVLGAGVAYTGDGIIRIADDPSAEAIAPQLIEAGLWETCPGGYRMTARATELILPDHAEELFE